MSRVIPEVYHDHAPVDAVDLSLPEPDHVADNQIEGVLLELKNGPGIEPQVLRAKWDHLGGDKLPHHLPQLLDSLLLHEFKGKVQTVGLLGDILIGEGGLGRGLGDGVAAHGKVKVKNRAVERRY